MFYMAYADSTKIIQTLENNHRYLKYWCSKFFIKCILMAKKRRKKITVSVVLDKWTD